MKALQCATLIFVFIAAAIPSSADLTFVACDGSCYYLTIQEGLNVTASGDTVYVMDGVYTGPQNRNLDFDGKDITLIAHEWPTSDTIIDCELEGRAFEFRDDDGPGVIVDGFIIRNGAPPAGEYEGGAVYCWWTASASFSDCRFENCQAAGGGAVYCESVMSGTITTTFLRCVFENNSAVRGGAIGVGWGGHAWVENCEFRGNTAQLEGGAISANDGAVAVTGSWFQSNSAPLGGAIRARDGWTFNGPMLVEYSTFVGNSAEQGGAMSLQFSGHSIVDHCTLLLNGASVAGGGIHYGAQGPNTETLTNTVIAFSVAGEAVVRHLDPVIIDHCLSFGNAGGDTLPDGLDNLYTDPLLCKLHEPPPCDNSPCLPPGNPWAEYIGAHSSGCPPCTGTGIAGLLEETSWGVIKAMFR